MKRKLIAIFSLLAVLCAGGASADWERAPYGAADHYSFDAYERQFTLTVRGGAIFGTAGMQNDLGALGEPFWMAPDGTLVLEDACFPNCIGAGYTYVGTANVGNLPVHKKYSSFGWVGGVGVGWVLPTAPNWRLEANWDHISESEYNSVPLYSGTTTTETGIRLFLESGGVSSKMSTDIFSAMFYYDFNDGCGGHMQMCKVIPYVGFGFGYATSRTVMQLTDIFGDLSAEISMQPFGEPGSFGTLEFYTSETTTGNFAGSLAAGLSYGIAPHMFLDFGLRVHYIPRIKWELNNAADPTATSFKSKDMFSAKNLMYGSLTLGLRFEF